MLGYEGKNYWGGGGGGRGRLRGEGDGTTEKGTWGMEGGNGDRGGGGR